MPRIDDPGEEISRIEESTKRIEIVTQELDRAATNVRNTLNEIEEIANRSKNLAHDIQHAVKRAERLGWIALAIAAIGTLPVIREFLQNLHVIK